MRAAASFLLLVAVAFSASGNVPGEAASGKRDEPDGIRVMSFNIRNGEANDGTNSWPYRCPAVAMMIEDTRPAVLGLQEAYYYQLYFITENLLQYEAVGVGREDGKREGEYAAIVYDKKRVSLKKWGTFWLSETPSEPSTGWDAACRRTATWALMKDKASGRNFLFVNTHLDHVGREAREKGLQLIADRIAEINRDNLPVVLTGDFNVTPDDPVLKVLDGRLKNVRDIARKTDRQGTFNNWGRSDDVIDYIFCSGFSSCPEFRTVREHYADRTFISDHYPVEALLRF